MAFKKIFGTCMVTDCGRDAAGRINGHGQFCRRCVQRWLNRVRVGKANAKPSSEEEALIATSGALLRGSTSPSPRPRPARILTSEELKARAEAMGEAEAIEAWLSDGPAAELRLVFGASSEKDARLSEDSPAVREAMTALAAKLRRRALEVQ